MMRGKTEGRRRGRQQKIRWLNGVTDSIHMSLNKPQEMVRDREAWPAVSMGLQRVGHDVVTEQQQQPTMGIMKSTQLKHIQNVFFFVSYTSSIGIIIQKKKNKKHLLQ